MAGKPNLFIVSGPSGSGKSTVVEYLLEQVPGTLFSVSHTTRAPREAEQDGRDYFFVSPEEFKAMNAEGQFLEFNYHFGHWYGTHMSNLDRAAGEDKDLLLDVDIEGARQIKGRMPEAVAVLFIPPSREELERRLRLRGQDTDEVVGRRLERAREEIARFAVYDYLVVNDKLEEAKAQMRAILCSVRANASDGAAGCPDFGPEGEALAISAREENNAERVSAILKTFTAADSEAG